MSKEKQTAEVLVIGGGPGGYAAAFRAADLGKKVTIVDPEENPGGVCLYRGCIPTKALLHAAEIKLEADSAGEMGLDFKQPGIDIERLRSWKDDVVSKLTKGLGQLSKQRKVEFIRGTARFSSEGEVTIAREDEQEQTLRYEHAIIATGAVPRSLPVLSFDSDYVWSFREALLVPEIPEKLLVVGGGYIGLELGTVYAALGSQVTIVELLPTIIPLADKDVIRAYRREAKKLFKSIRENTKTEFEETDGGMLATFSSGEKEEQERFDKVLLAVGRAPQTDGLGLENTSVEVDDDGFIVTDEQMRTKDAAIFAVGDVAGQPLLAHKGSHEGRVAAEVIAGKNIAFEPNAIPAVEYTVPQVAWCGITENEAEEEGREVKTATFPWSASGRNATLGKRSGMTKLIIDPSNDRVIGGAVVGKDAGELIPEIALAVEMAARASDLSLTIHPHPTLSETIMEAAQAYYGSPTSIPGE